MFNCATVYIIPYIYYIFVMCNNNNIRFTVWYMGNTSVRCIQRRRGEVRKKNSVGDLLYR